MTEFEDFEVPPCTLTGKVNYKDFAWGAYHLNLAPPIRVAKCNDTGMLYLCPRPNKKNRDLMLQGAMPAALKAYGERTYNYSSVDDMRQDDFVSRIKKFNRRFPSGLDKRLLVDVGTSGGKFMEVAREAGWEVKGLEPFDEDVKRCRSKGLDVVQGVAEQLPYPDSLFDIVHTSHVFEHLEDPLKAASEAHRVLKPGGLIFIEVPNQLDNFGFHRDMLFQTVQQRKRNIASIHHLWFFGRSTLRRLLETAGFEEVVIENVFPPPAKGWRWSFSWLSHQLGQFFYGSYILRGYGFKKQP